MKKINLFKEICDKKIQIILIILIFGIIGMIFTQIIEKNNRGYVTVLLTAYDNTDSSKSESIEISVKNSEQKNIENVTNQFVNKILQNYNVRDVYSIKNEDIRKNINKTYILYIILFASLGFLISIVIILLQNKPVVIEKNDIQTSNIKKNNLNKQKDKKEFKKVKNNVKIDNIKKENLKSNLDTKLNDVNKNEKNDMVNNKTRKLKKKEDARTQDILNQINKYMDKK